jgi:hypothetical protein
MDQVRGILDDITRDSEPEGGWSRFDRDPEALAWARFEADRYLKVLEGRSHHGSPGLQQGWDAALHQVRRALFGKPGAVGSGAFDERKASRIARTDTT